MRSGKARLWGALCLLCVGALSAPVLEAAGPTPYGEYFVRLGASWPDAGPIPSRPESAATRSAEEAEEYRRRLAELEQQAGPYADALAEPLADLALLARQNGDIAEAQRHYRRALHVVRVNEGLYSERQVPILRALFESYRLSGDLQILDERYDYFFRLYGNGKPPYTPVRLGATLEYLRWQREALRLEVEGDEKERLLNLYQLNQQILDEVALDRAVDLPAYQELVMSQLRNLYLVQDRVVPKIELVGTGGPLSTGFANDWAGQDVNDKRLENLQQTGLGRGRELLEGLIVHIPEDEPMLLARAYLELADWNQWNGRRTDALAGYQQVIGLLHENKLDDLAEQWLGESVELPDNGAFWQPRLQSGPAGEVTVQASYDVSATGTVSNIHARVTDPGDDHWLGGLKRSLARTRFRPRFVDGHPEGEQQVVRLYVMKD